MRSRPRLRKRQSVSFGVAATWCAVRATWLIAAVELPHADVAIGRKRKAQRKRLILAAANVEEAMRLHVAVAPGRETRRIVERGREAVRRERDQRHDVTSRSGEKRFLPGSGRTDVVCRACGRLLVSRFSPVSFFSVQWNRHNRENCDGNFRTLTHAPFTPAEAALAEAAAKPSARLAMLRDAHHAVLSLHGTRNTHTGLILSACRSASGGRRLERWPPEMVQGNRTA